MIITIRNRQGLVGSLAIDRGEWEALSPCGKVLAIHDKARHITNGQPFDVLSVKVGA